MSKKRTACSISEMGAVDEIFVPSELKIEKTYVTYEAVIKNFCLFLEQTEECLLKDPVLLAKSFFTDENIALFVESEGIFCFYTSQLHFIT
jgi:hypothetical protein